MFYTFILYLVLYTHFISSIICKYAIQPSGCKVLVIKLTIYLPTYLPTYLTTYLPTYLPIYLSIIPNRRPYTNVKDVRQFLCCDPFS